MTDQPPPDGAGPRDSVLEKNLQALSSRNQGLVLRLGLPVRSSHVRIGAAGRDEYCLRRAWRDLGFDPAAAAQALSGLDLSAGKLFVFGIGAGEILPGLLAQHPGVEITAWERDPWLLRRFLSRHDVACALERGRLQLHLGADLLDCLPLARACPRLAHPLLGLVYRHEQAWIDRGMGPKRALLCEGELFVDDLAEALVEEGYTLAGMDTELLSVEEMSYLVLRFQPSLVAGIDYRQGLAEFCEAHGVGLLSWEINPTTDRVVPCQGPTSRSGIFTYRKAQVEEFLQAGFDRVEYLPLAANPSRRKALPLSAEDQGRYGAEISFVGASMQVEARQYRERFLELYLGESAADRGSRSRVVLQLETVLAEQQNDYSAHRLPELVRAAFPDLTERWPSARTREEPLKLLNEVAAADKRARYLGALADLGIHVWGDEGWLRVLPAGCCYRGEAHHGTELTKVYCATRINIDVNRLYQMDIVPMRVFDILACGGFLIAERSEALEELFAIGSELEAYRTLTELKDKIRFYRSHPQAARDIGRAGMAKVRESHTIAQRVRRMLAVMER